MPWKESDIPDQSGRVAVVTGSNSGIGLEAARALAAKGAEVVLACRSAEKAEAAARDIVERAPDAKVRVLPLDLANLGSIRAFAARLSEGPPRLDLLVDNAGVMAIPRALTADGFEMQFGTNHLGHFALTMLLLPNLAATPGSRVVVVSSVLHRAGRIDFDDLMGERRYQKWRAYSQSKLANLLFTYELERRLRRAGAPVIAVAAHPGYAATNLQRVGPRLEGAAFMTLAVSLGNSLLAQSAAMGALPTVRAAVDPAAAGGAFYGPDSFRQYRGFPVVVGSNRRSRDEDVARLLWGASERLTGTAFPL